MPTNTGTSTFDSIPNSLTAQALANNFAKEEQARRNAADVNKDFYYGRQKTYVELFNLEAVPVWVNLTHPVIHKRSSLLYNRKLVRTIEGPSASIKFLDQVYEDNDIDSFLLQVDLLSELTGSVLVSPVMKEDEEGVTKVKLLMWDGSQISVIADEEDPTVPAAVSLIKLVDRLVKGWEGGVPQNERLIMQQVWTNEGVVTWEGKTNVQSDANTLGFLPFVNFQGEEVWGNFIGHPPAELVRNINQVINQVWTDLAYMIKMQAGTPIVIEGYKSGEPVQMQPGQALTLPVGASAGVLNLNPKINESLAVLQELEEKLFETSSVPKVSIVGGEGNSGRELLVRWFPIVDVYREKSVRYEKYEFNLANLILRMADLEPIIKLDIQYPGEENLPLSPSEENLEQDIVLGIRSPLDEIMRRKPNLTKDEALAEALENKEDSGILGLVPLENTPPGPEDEEGVENIEDEDNLEPAPEEEELEDTEE